MFAFLDKRDLDFLDEKEKEELAKIEAESREIEAKKVQYLKEIARKKGVMADSLEGLKAERPESFMEFVEIEPTHLPFRYAELKDKKTGLLMETAYFCKDSYSTRGDCCGWVKGSPSSQKYDDLAPLSGSAGIRYYCGICGKMIAEKRLRIA